MLHDEAGGQHSALATFSPRVALGLSQRVNLLASYGFSFAQEGTLLSASSQYHRLSLRPELLIPLGSASLALSLGPALKATHTTYFDKGTAALSGTSWQLGAQSGIALDVKLNAVTVRAGFETLATYGRTDFIVGLGAAYAFGDTP
jgi:hypothetical protein